MSAVNVAIAESKGTGYILTDSAAYGLDRKISGHRSKVLAVPHARFAVACRGSVEASNRAMHLFDKCSSFDDAVAFMTGKLPNISWIMALGLLAKIPILKPALGMEIILVGWSDRTGKIAAVSGSNLSRRPFKPTYSPVMLAPALPPEELRWLPKLQEDNYGAWPGILVGAMKRQRELCAARPDGEIISGAVICTEITADGISQRIMTRFDDPIGGGVVIDDRQAGPGFFGLLTGQARL